jgi:excisionase family DNA binding protein
LGERATQQLDNPITPDKGFPNRQKMWRKNMGERLLKPADVAEILQVSKAHAYVLMNRGEIPLVRIEKIVRIRLEDLERYIKEKTAQNEAPISQ